MTAKDGLDYNRFLRWFDQCQAIIKAGRARRRARVAGSPHLRRHFWPKRLKKGHGVGGR